MSELVLTQYFRDGRLVGVEKTLYHGTAFTNLKNILKHGLKPGGGLSPHRTKTRSALFFTDSLPGALGYSTAGAHDVPIVVLEVETKRLKLEPDYDDAAIVLSVDVQELNELLRDESRRSGERWGAKIKRGLLEEEGDLEIGDEISDELLDDVESALRQLSDSGDRATPNSLEVGIDNGKAYLYARPYVFQGIAYEFAQTIPELYDDEALAYDEGRPGLLLQQFLCRCDVPVSAIKNIYLDAVALKELGIEVSRKADKKVTDYNIIDTPTEMLELSSSDNEAWQEVYENGDVKFRTEGLWAFSPKELAQEIKK